MHAIFSSSRTKDFEKRVCTILITKVIVLEDKQRNNLYKM